MKKRFILWLVLCFVAGMVYLVMFGLTLGNLDKVGHPLAFLLVIIPFLSLLTVVSPALIVWSYATSYYMGRPIPDVENGRYRVHSAPQLMENKQWAILLSPIDQSGKKCSLQWRALPSEPPVTVGDELEVGCLSLRKIV